MKYANRGDLLSGAGSRLNGGRWNPPDKFNVVYGSLDPETAIAESLGTYSSYGVPPAKARPRVFAAVDLQLQAVLDIREPAVLGAMGVKLQQLMNEDWAKAQSNGDEALTQAIGRIAFELELEGIIVPSVQRASGGNLAAFPGRRRTGNSWKIQGARDLPKKT